MKTDDYKQTEADSATLKTKKWKNICRYFLKQLPEDFQKSFFACNHAYTRDFRGD
jgi:hypothetical protein